MAGGRDGRGFVARAESEARERTATNRGFGEGGGAKKKPFYHVVVADRRNRRDGRFIEQLGYFNPVAANQTAGLQLNQERVNYWLGQGAQPTERVSYLIKQFAKQPEK